jgi:hypothetical protein
MRTKEIIRLLKDARQAATMERMQIAPNNGFPSDSVYTKQVVADTRIYRESWIISPIDEALELLEAE